MTSVPSPLSDPALLQQILAKLSAETARADLAEKHSKELEVNRDEWKAAAAAERARGDKLAEAEAARRSEAEAARASAGYLRQSVDDYKVQREEDKRTIRSLESSRKWYLVGGAATGVIACSAVRQLSP